MGKPKIVRIPDAPIVRPSNSHVQAGANPNIPRASSSEGYFNPNALNTTSSSTNLAGVPAWNQDGARRYNPQKKTGLHQLIL